MKTAKMTERAIFLLKEIAAGRNRVFYFSDSPVGWVYIERAGYAVRNADGTRADITESGREYINNLSR